MTAEYTPPDCSGERITGSWNTFEVNPGETTRPPIYLISKLGSKMKIVKHGKPLSDFSHPNFVLITSHMLMSPGEAVLVSNAGLLASI